ncbi:MAG: lytic transglycosylase domain-containing protein [Lachnospiraceae bacterium]|nr:lytic transglycosylase domain-containing protein [Lachnospiraceae bacterium]
MAITVKQIQSFDPVSGASAGVVQESAGEPFAEYLKTGAKTLKDIFTEASEKYQVPFSLLTAVGMQESTFRADAVSKAGAQGIMQLMPKTAAGLGVTDSFDPEQNINGGAKYLRELLDKYDGNISFALAAYNAGGNNVDKYGGIPPFKETQNYVEKVLGYMNTGVTLPDGTVTKGTPVTAAAPGEEEINTASSANDTGFSARLRSLLFSYNDYLKFIELYLQLIAMRNKKTEEEQEKQEQEAYQAYKNQQQSPAARNLFTTGTTLI